VQTVSATTALPAVPSANNANGVADLGSQDFFKLLIAQLTNQDPMQPMDNQDLLNQISSIRDIELSTGLTESLQSVVGQQRFASASTMIANYVRSFPGADGLVRQGIVVGVRFEGDGTPQLQLADGTELAIDQVASVEPADRAAQSYIGSTVVGLDRSVLPQGQAVEGRVTGVSLSDQGGVTLELDTGQRLRIEDVVSTMAADVASVADTLASIF